MNNKYLRLMLFSLGLILILGISYAYFATNILGNEEAKNHKVETANLELTYTDTNEISLENAFPGDSFTKVISVKNTGTLNSSYNLIWQTLTNEIINDELVIEATCKRIDNNIESGTCENITSAPISSTIIKNKVLIEPNITHEYTIKVTFLETGNIQDYNKNKTFYGKLGIKENNSPTSVSFAEDSWSTIVKLVKSGDTSTYNVGDTKVINLGEYGTHTVRIANKSNNDNCNNENYSQTACGFVIEFADIILTKLITNTSLNTGGWAATTARTFINNEIFNSLPTDLQNGIIDTRVISSHGLEDSNNFTTTDKLYFLAPTEIYNDWSDNNDTARTLTNILDYYKELNVTTTSSSGAIKKKDDTVKYWWLRSIGSTSSYSFYRVGNSGDISGCTTELELGYSPAFRIG